MSTKLKKKVIDGIAPVTLASCVMLGDGTDTTVEGYLNALDLADSAGKYSGKTALWLGDSISVVGTPTYPQSVCNTLGMTLINKASSGGNAVRMRLILQGLEGYTAPDLSGVDFVFMMIGHNCDATYGVTASDASIDNIPTDDTSYEDYPNGFYTDVASCIEYIWAQKSSIEIFLITPLQGATTRYIPTTAKAQTALKEIGNMYSCKVIDVYAECGICRRTIGLYTYDDIHPNADGITKISDCIVAYLLSH